ncbi:MAG: Do family serine endopeptidase [Rhodospirillales bacterium]|nr:Do family serine endopeptidase [Rhodospirillales bacterium]MDP6804451.1 Do family serine endopeptidase [Rhodospirillales bacterium]
MRRIGNTTTTAFGRGWRGLAGVAVVFGLAATLTLSAGAAERRIPESENEVRLSFAPLVRKAAPAVVNIYTRRVRRSRQAVPLFDDPFFRRFFGEGFGLDQPRERVQNSLGSGVIVRADGLVVTNNHVIEGADEIKVILNDRRQFEASVVVTDERTDLAVLKALDVDAELPSMQLEDSDELEVGDLVLAIGNPFGVGQTVTSGIVSALARTQLGVSDLSFFIQTDAAINPGNSGGALVSMDGNLVGINTAIFSKSGGSHGIGFATPSNMVHSILVGLTDDGRLIRPWFGAWGQRVSPEIASSLAMERPTGVLINEVYPDGPAARADLRVGDVVLAVSGHEVDDPTALRFRIATLPVGETASLRIWRQAHEATLSLSLAPPPEDPPRDVTEIGGRNPFSGATVANMSPALAEELGLDRFGAGVTVLDIRAGSAAARLRLQAGDVIVSVNGEEPGIVDELDAALARPAERWRIAIERDGRVRRLVVEL